MERVTLGRSGLSVSPVAFGTWQLSPRFWGEQSKSDAISAMRQAFELGFTGRFDLPGRLASIRRNAQLSGTFDLISSILR